VIGAQSLERRDDFVLRDFNSVGDHARGLFEAEASIAASAAHAFEYVEIVFFAHRTPFKVQQLKVQRFETGFNLVVRFAVSSCRSFSRNNPGEPYLLCCQRFDLG
jgi:hypothetical protein